MHEVAAELRRLQRDDGRVLPADVVDAARDPASPLHAHFTWDDDRAAGLRRLDEARALIRRVRIEVTVRDIPLIVPAYVRDPELDPRHAGYIETTRLRTEEDAARAAIVAEMQRVAHAVRRAKSLAIVLGVADAIEQIETIARGVTARISNDELNA